MLFQRIPHSPELPLMANVDSFRARKKVASELYSLAQRRWEEERKSFHGRVRKIYIHENKFISLQFFSIESDSLSFSLSLFLSWLSRTMMTKRGGRRGARAVKKCFFLHGIKMICCHLSLFFLTNYGENAIRSNNSIWDDATLFLSLQRRVSSNENDDAY